MQVAANCLNGNKRNMNRRVGTTTANMLEGQSTWRISTSRRAKGAWNDLGTSFDCAFWSFTIVAACSAICFRKNFRDQRVFFTKCHAICHASLLMTDIDNAQERFRRAQEQVQTKAGSRAALYWFVFLVDWVAWWVAVVFPGTPC